MMNNQAPPVKEGEEIIVSIDAVGGKGDGIARKSGFVIFVPGAKKGQHVKIKITKVLTNVSFAEVVEEVKKEKSEIFETVSAAQEPIVEQEHPEDSEDF